MARPAHVPGQAPTPERLLDAAEDAFAEQGFTGARLADIASVAGVRRPSLIHHFGSKESLYAAVVERVFGDLGEVLARAMEQGGELATQLVTLTECFTRFVEARPAVARVLLRELLDDRGPGREILLRQAVPMLRLVEAFIRREGGDDLPPDYPLRGSLMQAVANVLLWSVAGPLRAPLWGGGHHAIELARAVWGPALPMEGPWSSTPSASTPTSSAGTPA